MLKSVLLLITLAAPARAAPSFVKEDGVRITSAVLQGASAAQIAGGTRFYYIRGSTAVYSAFTTDSGESFNEESGVRLSTCTEPRLDVSSITGLSILKLTDNTYRMLYSAIGSTGTLFRVYSASSTDGLSWYNDTGTRIEVNGGTGFAGYPSLIKLATGDWRVYYVQNYDGGTASANRRVYTALSSNQGLNFSTGTRVLDSRADEVAAVQLTDNRVRLYYTAPLTGETTSSTILSALSAEGNEASFSSETGTRLATASASGYLCCPFVIRSTDTWRWKLYYNWNPFSAGASTAAVYSASTYAPDPVSISPSTVLRTTGATAFSIKGENFSGGASGGSSPAFQLSQGATTVAGTLTARTDDQNVSVTFNMQGYGLGHWDLTATNDNGFTGTLSHAVYLDFAPGEVRLTDNLMRPRLGTRTKIDVMTYNSGRLSVRLYTLTGKLVATLLDQDAPEGTTTAWWDGRTSLGNTVASGVYLLHTVGEKVNSRDKIVVIK